MRYKKIVAEKIKSDIYTKIIQVNVPTRFYWTEDGFDGLEFSAIPRTTRHQLRLLNEVLDGTLMGMNITATRRTPIPDTILKAFENNKRLKGN